jgi:hypothetical protein
VDLLLGIVACEHPEGLGRQHPPSPRQPKGDFIEKTALGPQPLAVAPRFQESYQVARRGRSR